jgi:hypothetical protein
VREINKQFQPVGREFCRLLAKALKQPPAAADRAVLDNWDSFA